MRARGATARVRATALQHHDRLRCGEALGRANEATTVAHRFDEAGDERAFGIVSEVLENVRQLDVGLVPDREEAGDTEPARSQVAEDEAAVRAALRDDTDAAGRRRQVPEVCAVELRRRGVDAHAVRADEP